MSPYRIAREQIDAALAAGAEAGLDADAVLRAVLGTLVERYRELKGVEDLKAVLRYQLDNAADDDIEFMRP